MKKSLVLATVLAVSSATGVLHADTFQGSVIRAQLIFLNDPGLSGPSGTPVNLLTGGTGFTGTRATVSAGQEYSYNDGVATYSANFNAGGFTIRVKCDQGVSLATCNTEPGFEWIFKDAAFATSNLTLDYANTTLSAIPESDLYDPTQIGVLDLLSSPLSSVLGIPPGSFALTLKNSKLVVDVTPAATTPEPAGIALLSTGVLGILGAARRRFRS